MIESVLETLSSGDDLPMDEMTGAMDAIMSGSCSESEITRFLLGLNAKGETVDEVAGAAQAMRQHMQPIRSHREGLLDTCGTGGGGARTFNISTAAAFVVAAAGVPVAKHGNRAVTSQSGSSDVLSELGVNLMAIPEQMEKCLEELGICFCFAPLMHPAMKHVAEVRKKLGVRTIFNLIGPLCNPAGAPYQLLGVGRPELRPLLAQALAKLGTQRAVVVHGEQIMDEVSLMGVTEATEVGPASLREFTWHPHDFGMQPCDLQALVVEGPSQSAKIVRGIFGGDRGPARDIVVINAAAALWTVRHRDSLEECLESATGVLDDGHAGEILERFIELSNSC